MIQNSQDVASDEDGIASLFSFGFFGTIYEANLSQPQDHQHQSEKINQHFLERSASRHVPLFFKGLDRAKSYGDIVLVFDDNDRVVFRGLLDELWTETPQVGFGREGLDDRRLRDGPERVHWQELVAGKGQNIRGSI